MNENPAPYNDFKGQDDQTGTKTHIVLCIDTSSSMHPVAESTSLAINTYVSKQSREPGECYISIVEFASTIHETPGICVTKFSKYVLHPGGMTKLREGIANGITILEDTPDVDHKILAVFTDGAENYSDRKYSRAYIERKLEENPDINTVFFGANQNAILAGGNLGISAQSCASYNHNDTSTQTSFEVLARKTSELRGKKKGAKLEGFTQQERNIIQAR